MLPLQSVVKHDVWCVWMLICVRCMPTPQSQLQNSNCLRAWQLCSASLAQLILSLKALDLITSPDSDDDP